MYFWNIKKLKTQLIAGPLTERETLPYLIATVLMYSLVQYFPDALPFNSLDYLEIVIASLGALLGTLWLYYKNMADAGSNFLQRYISLGWVVTIRVIVFALPVALAIVFLADTLGQYNDESGATNWIDIGIAITIELFLYLYFGKHLADVAQKTTGKPQEQL